MSIVTKTGDRGRTSLCCGTMVNKDDIRIEVCGCLDEVSSFLGMAKNIVKDAKTKQTVNLIQKELFVLGAEIATTARAVGRLKRRINRDSVCFLEKEIYCLEKERAVKIRSFCIPGESSASSALHVARAVARRAERRCVTMSRKGMIKNNNIAVYLNRLSDLLYLLARAQEKRRAKFFKGER